MSSKGERQVPPHIIGTNQSAEWIKRVAAPRQQTSSVRPDIEAGDQGPSRRGCGSLWKMPAVLTTVTTVAV